MPDLHKRLFTRHDSRHGRVNDGHFCRFTLQRNNKAYFQYLSSNGWKCKFKFGVCDNFKSVPFKYWSVQTSLCGSSALLCGLQHEHLTTYNTNNSRTQWSIVPSHLVTIAITTHCVISLVGTKSRDHQQPIEIQPVILCEKDTTWNQETRLNEKKNDRDISFTWSSCFIAEHYACASG